MSAANHNLKSVLTRITRKLQQDQLVSKKLHELREILKVDRVVLYYFYTHWKGQVTFEALSDQKYSIIGSTGADDCFNIDYASLYLAGRIFSTEDIEKAAINECHRDFLRTIQVRSNLVAPVVCHGKLWGLLVAHHCQQIRQWQSFDIDTIRQYSYALEAATSISSS